MANLSDVLVIISPMDTLPNLSFDINEIIT